MALRRLGAALLLLPLLAAVEGERAGGRAMGAGSGRARAAAGAHLRPAARKVCPGARAGRRWPRGGVSGRAGRRGPRGRPRSGGR